MSSAMPYVKWHGRDWLGDPMLRMVGPEVRGVWMDLLCAMMNAEPYGHLAVNGKPMTDEQAARLAGLDKGTFMGILEQIESAHISSRTEDGMLYSRRLVRDHAQFVKASECGRKGGGNPLLREKNEEARSQKPEARSPIKGTFIGQPKVSLPFSSPAFVESWRGYVEHRRRIRKPMTDRAQSMALAKLPKDEATAIRWIDNAVEKGWQGIYEPGEGKSSSKPKDSGLINTWHQPDSEATRKLREAF